MVLCLPQIVLSRASIEMTLTRRVTRLGTVSLVGPYVASIRGAASYPVPRSNRTRTVSAKKKYNYLTSERLVETQRNRTSRQVIRHRDDLAKTRRQDYRRLLVQDVETRIRYFPSFVTDFVFFPQKRNAATARLFRGNRALLPRQFTRVYCEVLKQLCSYDNRDALKQLMKKAGVEVPAQSEWDAFADPKTGDLTLPLAYSPWMKRQIVELMRRTLTDEWTPEKRKHLKLSPQLAYIALNLQDTNKVPTLMEWSMGVGKLCKEEMIQLSPNQESVRLSMSASRLEIARYGKDAVQSSLTSMSLAEQRALVNKAQERMPEIRKAIERQHLFAAHVLVAVNTLPEVRAIQRSSAVFIMEEECKWVIEHKGAYYPPCPVRLKEWKEKSTEERDSYSCFQRKVEVRTSTALQLYIRYCARDYGINRSEATRRFSQLSELQRAALHFPFYYSIAPKKSSSVAFRRFYTEMCSRYGLMRSHSSAQGNRLFEVAMRRKWNAMSPDARMQFDDTDAIEAAFPLLPSAGATKKSVLHSDAEEDPIAFDGTAEDAAFLEKTMPNAENSALMGASLSSNNKENLEGLAPSGSKSIRCATGKSVSRAKAERRRQETQQTRCSAVNEAVSRAAKARLEMFII